MGFHALLWEPLSCFARGFPRVALGTFVLFRMWVSTRCSGNLCLVSHVDFHALLWKPLSCFARGFPRVALGTSAGSCRCCVTSPGSRVGITAVDAAGSAMLRLWHGLGLLQMVGFKASVQQTGFQVNLARVGGRSKSRKRVQEHKRESENADAPRLLNCPVLDPPTGGWSNQCPYGAEPRPCPWFLWPCPSSLISHSFRER